MEKKSLECVVLGSRMLFDVDEQGSAYLKSIISGLNDRFSNAMSEEVVLTDTFRKKLIELVSHFTYYKAQSGEGKTVNRSLSEITSMTERISKLLD